MLYDPHPAKAKSLKKYRMSYSFSDTLSTGGRQSRDMSFVEIQVLVLRRSNVFLSAIKNGDELTGAPMDISEDVHQMKEMEHLQRLGYEGCWTGRTTGH